MCFTFCFQEPVTIVLGTKRKVRGTGRKRKCKEVTNEMKYIPILKLERLFQDQTVYEEVIHD